MNALTFQGKETILYSSVADPKILAPSDVILKIQLAGICGSDLHPYHEREKGLDAGTVMGHEAVGTVVEVGSEVKSLRNGDHVFGPFTTSCGQCPPCLRGLTCRCVHSQLFGWVEKGRGVQGLQAEFARIPLAEGTLKKIPEGITAEEALLLGDVFSTGFFCADLAGANEKGSYAVLGCGPVGLMAILGARILGAQRIFAIDSLPERLEMARKFGATPLSLSNDPLSLIKDATEGFGVDAVMEAVGNASAQRLAWELVRPGGTIAVAGVCTDPQFAFSPADAYNKNLTYRVGRCPARHYMDRLAPVVQEKRFDITSVISHRLPLADGTHGYHVFDKKIDRCTKVVLSTQRHERMKPASQLL